MLRASGTSADRSAAADLMWEPNEKQDYQILSLLSLTKFGIFNKFPDIFCLKKSRPAGWTLINTEKKVELATRNLQLFGTKAVIEKVPRPLL